MNSWLEKLFFALFPVMISGIIFLFHSVITLQDTADTLKIEAQLEREKLKEQFNKNISDLDKRVAIIESKSNH